MSDCSGPTLLSSNPNASVSNNSLVMTAESCNSSPTSTDIVLESMEDCVGCMDGIDQQHIFEEGLRQQAAHQRRIAMEHGLSEAEAALIRLQMIDIETTTKGVASSAAEGIRSAVENTLSTKIITPEMDDMLMQVCGAANPTTTNICLMSPISQSDSVSCDVRNTSSLSPKMCEGVVLPMDTTIPTSLPGNALVESKQAKSARSLVDVAADDDGIQEEKVEDLTIDEGAVYECAICNDSPAPDGILGSYQTNRKPIFCRLPCCEPSENYNNCGPQGGKRSNFKVCTACMLVLTVATKDGSCRVGRCPRCRGWISLLTLHSTSASMVVHKLDSSGKCESCLQVKPNLIFDEPAICDACFLATETSPLTYECEECHRPQPIQATLYRSQPSSKAFGNEMCPCKYCQKSTHWRLLDTQLSLIPANDVPEEWGDDFLELARTRVQTARQGIAKLDLPGQNAMGEPTTDEGCTIM
eukprot:CAMPEP_0172370908 /NCGR_PEP_ID=MMETSP1060-20121228/40339_1 /TAXON_ID=37318 /ORGANISM="Pseudo-nitzschia pungens, Strain cf. cingulata" /LENGTH=469 /DNA_ID=CAMNT_0013096369 /DNA_START=138 /DNA_END=1547 /DNA_ORIENTATION=+